MKKIVFLAIICLSIIACGERVKEKESKSSSVETKTEITVRGEAQGTTYTIKYIAEEYNGIKEEIDSVLQMIDQSMSTYIPNSVISHLNDGDTVILGEHFQAVYQLSMEINKATDGAFDPTIGPLIKAWGFDYSKPEEMDSTKVKSLLSICGFEQFQRSNDTLWKKIKDARINFNAIAQGYAVDLMATVLDMHQIENYYVELGGELVVKGKNKFSESWIIGIDLPNGENLERQLANRMQLENGGMATSGNYRKFYEVDGERYSHTLNPSSGYPAKNKLLSATVLATDAGTADALATAFMVMGVEKTKNYLAEYSEIDALLIFAIEEDKFGTFVTKGMEDRLLKD